MSSAIVVSSLPFSSSSKASMGVFIFVASFINTVFLALSGNTTVETNAFKPTSTVKFDLPATRSAPLQPKSPLSISHIVIYIVVVFVCLVQVLRAKGFMSTTADASSYHGPPNPDPPPPVDPVTISQVPADPGPEHPLQIAAAGAPPPPPPGDDTTGDSKRRPRWSFGLFGWLYRIIAWIISRLVSLLKSLFVILIWRPIVTVLFFVVLPATILCFANMYDITPIIVSSTGPYIFLVVKLLIDLSPTLRWFVRSAIAYSIASSMRALSRVVKFIYRNVVWVIRSLILGGVGILKSIKACICGICSIPRRVAAVVKWLVFQCFEEGSWDGHVAFVCFLILTAASINEMLKLFYWLLPLTLAGLKSWRQTILTLHLTITQDVFPIIVSLIQASELPQTAVFWWEWLFLPAFNTPRAEIDRIIIVGLALLWLLVRWLLSSRWGDRAARAKMNRRIKILEARLRNRSA